MDNKSSGMLSPSSAGARRNSGERRRRSSSIIGHLEPETVQEQSDQMSSIANLNASWVHFKGAWVVHIVIIVLLLIVYDLIPGTTQELTWTLTNITYVTGTWIMFHYVTGVPFEFNGGAYDSLTMWEQIDDGDQYTPTKKFLLGVPIGLFLISTHYTHYDLVFFAVNCIACVVSVIPKLPTSHRLRILMPDTPLETPPPERS